MWLLVAAFFLFGNHSLAFFFIFGHPLGMFGSGSRSNFGFSPLLFALWLATNGCDRNPTAPDVPSPPRKTETDSVPSTPQEKEAPVEEVEEAEGPNVPQAAREIRLPSPRFDQTAPPAFRQAFEKFQKWVDSQKGRIHAALVDLEDDRWLLKADAQRPINVASNAKIVTAAAALELLGPAYTFKTELFGDFDEPGKVERLVLRGGGAPDLDVADLWRLLDVALGMGLSEVGQVIVDQSLFSAAYVPPSYDQQPNEWAPFRANIAALSLNQNAVDLNVFTTEAGSPARVWYHPAGVVQPHGGVKTGKSGTGDRVTWTLDAQQDPARLLSRTGGSLAEGLGRRRYSRRLDDPRLAGGLAFRQLLQQAGVQVRGEVSLGKKAKESRLALWKSKPLAELLREVGKESNNFYAEMLLVALSSSAEASNEADETPWSSETGARVVRSYLGSKGIDLQGIVVKNGSGLFDANRYSTELLAKVLAAVEDNPRIFSEFVGQLAIAGVDGTMEKRMQGAPLAGRIRAKTGTLRSCIALSGYVQRTLGRSPAAFSLVVTGISGQNGAIRKRMDDLVLEWAEILEDRKSVSSEPDARP